MNHVIAATNQKTPIDDSLLFVCLFVCLCLCFTSLQRRGHLEAASPFTVHCGDAKLGKEDIYNISDYRYY